MGRIIDRLLPDNWKGIKERKNEIQNLKERINKEDIHFIPVKTKPVVKKVSPVFKLSLRDEDDG